MGKANGKLLEHFFMKKLQHFIIIFSERDSTYLLLKFRPNFF